MEYSKNIPAMGCFLCYTLRMRRAARVIIGFLAILAIGVVGVLVGNHFEWFSDNTVTAAQTRTGCVDKTC